MCAELPQCCTSKSDGDNKLKLLLYLSSQEIRLSRFTKMIWHLKTLWWCWWNMKPTSCCKTQCWIANERMSTLSTCLSDLALADMCNGKPYALLASYESQSHWQAAAFWNNFECAASLLSCSVSISHVSSSSLELTDSNTSLHTDLNVGALTFLDSGEASWLQTHCLCRQLLRDMWGVSSSILISWLGLILLSWQISNFMCIAWITPRSGSLCANPGGGCCASWENVEAATGLEASVCRAWCGGLRFVAAVRASTAAVLHYWSSRPHIVLTYAIHSGLSIKSGLAWRKIEATCATLMVPSPWTWACASVFGSVADNLCDLGGGFSIGMLFWYCSTIVMYSSLLIWHSVTNCRSNARDASYKPAALHRWDLWAACWSWGGNHLDDWSGHHWISRWSIPERAALIPISIFISMTLSLTGLQSYGVPILWERAVWCTVYVVPVLVCAAVVARVTSCTLLNLRKNT